MAARTTILLAKFVGTISLGLLTGVSYTLCSQTVPSLLALPSATTARHTFIRLQTLAKNHLRALSAISTTSFVLAYALSPSRSRHPYLLWTALTVALSGGVDFALRHNEDKLARSKRRGEDVDEEAPVNGEEVRKAMEEFEMAQMVRTGVAYLGFAMSVVGLWGDGA
ncbi:MAG: hypothetical protein M1827_006670 [Pycnora praestabilis]|nr:MAG: hypothetical protein M1827_006670 [Pycnora praestabilis]